MAITGNASKLRLDLTYKWRKHIAWFLAMPGNTTDESLSLFV
jgi:hypothetical protein